MERELWRFSYGYKLLSISFLDPRDFTSQDSRKRKIRCNNCKFQNQVTYYSKQKKCARIFN